MAGLTGGEYADGAYFVFDLLEYIEADNTITVGRRKRLDVMQYDSEKFAGTGGWGYESFGRGNETGRLRTDGGAACYECRLNVADSGYVYSKWRP